MRSLLPQSVFELSVCAALVLGVGACSTGRGPRDLASDDFRTRDRFADLTLLTLWGGNREPVSALEVVRKADAAGLTYSAVKMKDDAAPHSRWDQDLRASTALDYTFPRVDRSNRVITVECDVVWDELESGRKGKWGEGNRFLVALLHGYPKKGPKFGDLERTKEGHPFGRPAYHYRIRNIAMGMGAMMSYGGGAAGPEGEFEKYNHDGKTYWLPGFISSPARGEAPGDEKSYDGTKSPYPKTPTRKGGRVASDKEWRHLTWRVYPERMELFYRRSGAPVEEDRQVFFMDIPRIPAGSDAVERLRKRLASAHGLEELKELPPLYNWFPTVEAVRFYFRGNKTYLANVRVWVAATR